MIVLSEDSPRRAATPSAKENHQATETAKLLGLQVYYIPKDFEACETAENALAYVPVQEAETPCLWIGFIPSADRYAAIYDEAQKKKIRLLNTPDEHLRVQEFDRLYPYIQEITPESIVLTQADQAAAAIAQLGLPIFVKGTVQSRKSRGWKACVAESEEELARLTDAYLTLTGRTRGRVIARKLVRLRHVQSSPQGFPFGREYRVFLYRNDILAWGYYWEGKDPLEELTQEEQSAVLQMAQEASHRVGVPFVAVDIGQLENGDWIVIEMGDGQFAGVSKIPMLHLWNAIKQKVRP